MGLGQSYEKIHPHYPTPKHIWYQNGGAWPYIKNWRMATIHVFSLSSTVLFLLYMGSERSVTTQLDYGYNYRNEARADKRYSDDLPPEQLFVRRPVHVPPQFQGKLGPYGVRPPASSNKDS